MSPPPGDSFCFRRSVAANREVATRRWLTRLRAAFTLVELLVVMSIIAVLLAAVAPLMRGIMSGRNVSDGVSTISDYLAYTRTQAMTQNTYAIVGFYQTNGSDDLQMASVISANGTFNPAGFYPAASSGSAANYKALGRTIHTNNVTLMPKAGLSTQLQSKVPAASADAMVECSDWPTYSGSNPNYFSFRVENKPFKYCFIAFSPQGEALFFPSAPASTANVSANLPFYSQLFIGVRATRSGAVINGDVNSAAITLDGGSGDIKVYRL